METIAPEIFLTDDLSLKKNSQIILGKNLFVFLLKTHPTDSDLSMCMGYMTQVTQSTG